MNAQHDPAKKVAFVSGGSKGIGFAVVRALVRQGYFVVTCGRNTTTWAGCVEEFPELGQSVDFQECDLSQAAALEQLFAYVGKTYRQLAVAVNNASPAITSGGQFAQIHADALMGTLLSDLWVPALCMQHELKLMKDRGAIVNISSVNGIRPTPGAAMYSAAKHGLEGLTRSVALEAIGQGVRINAVAPGVTWTARWEQRIADGKASRAQVEEMIPMKRFAAADEIAAAVTWLVSDDASYVVGHTLVIDGGLALT
ncbi:NAD(P)-dependent dehydrogenase (short-subunit alcohol dehydrogenase family) [Actimicrobium sp. GrIS 1.19]|uniref:SDR family NAD(P)-dependent oxidoreductase n=1 Tax=Actimicrobium sp. GrIS 1.19 TaxID=3071708 RepID=UPI002E073BA5|nr:NAD(P)-dependent dehydrogenase (short-subunit alcohol dehydrogenase family) [Actimicrobium sp. GrIS 1.19]